MLRLLLVVTFVLSAVVAAVKFSGGQVSDTIEETSGIDVKEAVATARDTISRDEAASPSANTQAEDDKITEENDETVIADTKSGKEAAELAAAIKGATKDSAPTVDENDPLLLPDAENATVETSQTDIIDPAEVAIEENASDIEATLQENLEDDSSGDEEAPEEVKPEE